MKTKQGEMNESDLYAEFLRGFMEATGLPDAKADAQWAGYTRSLSDSERSKIERGGLDAGRREGLRFMKENW